MRAAGSGARGRSRVWVVRLAVGSAFTALATLTVPVAPADSLPAGVLGQQAAQTGSGVSLGADDQPLEAAGLAATRVSFVGALEVQWSDEHGEHRETLAVQGGNGAVVVRGPTAVMASAQQRLVEHDGGDWDLLWPVATGSGGRPNPTAKYQLTSSTGPIVSGRTSRLVEVRRGNDLLERLYLDEQTGILLRREQFEHSAAPYRTIGFESISFDATPPAPEVPPDVVNDSPTPLAPGHVPSGVSAPAALADGYQRLGVYRRSGVVQVLYSDGLYDLSVFQQDGRLNHRGLPASRVSMAPVDKSGGWHYSWAGGHVVLWEHDGVVYTAVSDAPLDQVLTAVRSLPPARPATSLLSRLREACRALVQPLSD